MKQIDFFLTLLTILAIAGAIYTKTAVVLLWWATVSGFLIWRGGW